MTAFIQNNPGQQDAKPRHKPDQMKGLSYGSIFFLTACLLLSLASCKPRKAMEFKERIVQKERVAFNILVGKNGSEGKKLDLLIKGDYKGAQAAIDQQEKEFNELLKSIETLQADDIKLGTELKAAAVQYYTALKQLQLSDRESIIHEEALHHLKGDSLETSQNKLLELSRQKQDLYKIVYERETSLYETIRKFDSANGIR